MARRGVALLALAAVLAACGGGSSGSKAAASAASASLKVRDEAASWRRPKASAFAAAHDGQRLGLGDTVRTNGTGFVDITYDDGSLTRLDANAQFTLVDLAAAKTSSRVVGKLSGGRAWSKVEHLTSSESRYEIDTDVATASVRGTQFDVDCRATDGSCTFSVVDGTVAVTPRSGPTIQLHAGESVRVHRPGVADAVAPVVADPWIERNQGLDGGGGDATTSSSEAGQVADIVYVEYLGGPNPDQGGEVVQVDCVRGKGCTMRNPFTGDGAPKTGTPGVALSGGRWFVTRHFDTIDCGGTGDITYDLTPQGTMVRFGVEIPARVTGTYHNIAHCPGLPDQVRDVTFDSPPENLGTDNF